MSEQIEEGAAQPSGLIARRTLITAGGLAAASAVGFGAWLGSRDRGSSSGTPSGTVRGDKIPMSRDPVRTGPSTPDAVPNSSGPSRSPTAVTPSASVSVPAPNLRPNTEMRPGATIGLFLGAAFIRRPGQSALTVIYNPLVTEEGVYFAERTATGIVSRLAAGERDVESWLTANATSVAIEINGFNNAAVRVFDGYANVRTIGVVATYARAQVGQTIGGMSNVAALKQAGAIGYYLDSVTDTTKIKTDMVLAGAAVPYPAD